MDQPPLTPPGELTLFGEPKPHEPYSADVAEAMKILSGGLTMATDEFGEPEIVPASGDPLPTKPANAQEKWQKTMLKKHELKEARISFLDFEVRAFDLSEEKDAKEYAAMLNEAGSPGSDRMIDEKEPFICADPNSARGFRCVTVVKFYRTKKMMPPGKDQPNYEVAPQLAAQI